MSSPATYSFGADAVRYGSDLSGQNSAYFLQQSSGTAVVPADLEVKGDLQVDGTSALKGAVTVGTPSAAVATTLNGTLGVSGASNFTGGAQVGSGLTVGGGLAVVSGNLAVSAAGASISAPNFQGTNPADGLRAAFQQGLIANTVTIAGSGGSTLLLGDATNPGGNVIGYNGSSATVPVNFPNGLASANMYTKTQNTVFSPLQANVPFVTLTQPGIYLFSMFQTDTAGTIGSSPYQLLDFVLVWRTPGNGLLNVSGLPISSIGTGFTYSLIAPGGANGTSTIGITIANSSANTVGCQATICRISGGP